MEKETEHPHYLGTKWRVLLLKPRPGMRSWNLKQESRVPIMPDSGSYVTLQQTPPCWDLSSLCWNLSSTDS